MRAPACLAVSLLAALAAAQTPRLDPQDPRPNLGNEGEVKVFHIGPYTLPAGRQIGTLLLPGEFEQFVPAPNPGDVYMTGFDSRIVDQNLVPQDPQLLYLHHAVLVKALAPDLTCARIGGERFAAAGAERIPFALPDGHGYRIRGSDTVFCILHMQNFTLAPKTVYYQFSMTVRPGSAALKEVRPLWLDVVNCTSTYIVPSGTGLDVRSAEFPLTQRMTVLTMGPHLHCGGVKLELIDKASQQLLHGFPNLNPCPVDLRTVLPATPLVLPAGSTVILRATYQRDPARSLDAMGILLSYVVLG